MGIKIGPIDIGDTKDSILNFDPITKDIGEGITKTVDDIVEGIEKTTDDIVSGLEKSTNDLVGAVENLVDDVARPVLDNPYVRLVASIIYPPAAPYLQAYGAAMDGKLELSEAVALAASVGGDLGYDINPDVAKAVKVGAEIAEGKDPLQTLATNYGADFAKEIGLDTQVSKIATDTFGEDAAAFINDRMDVNQAAADIVAGKSTERILADQFGDDAVNNLLSDDVSVQALGYAGIEGAVGNAEGLSEEEILKNSVNTYFDRGGKTPDLNVIANSAGLDMGDLNFDLGIKLPEFGVDLSKVDFSGLDFGDLGISGTEAFDFGVDLGQFDMDFDLEGTDIEGMDVDLGKLGDLGVDIGKLNIGDVSLLDYTASGLGNALAVSPTVKKSTVDWWDKGEEEGAVESESSLVNDLLQKGRM